MNGCSRSGRNLFRRAWPIGGLVLLVVCASATGEEAAPRFGPDPLESVVGGYVSQLDRVAGEARLVERVDRLAWILATHPDPRVRNGPAALALAEAVIRYAGDTRAEHLDTLAAARAECGDFDEAVRAESRAIGLIRHTSPARRDYELRRRLYESHIAFRDATLPRFVPEEVSHRSAAEAVPAYVHWLLFEPLADSAAPADAAAACREVLRLDASFRPARVRLGESLWLQGKLDQAAEQFEAAVGAWANDADTWIRLAAVRRRQGRISAAIDAYRRACALRPEEPAFTNELAWLLATNPDSQPGAAEEAIELARGLCRRRPADPDWFDTLAAAYAAAGEFDQAALAQREAMRRLREGTDARSDRSASAAKLREFSDRLRLYALGQPYRNDRQLEFALGRQLLEKDAVDEAAALLARASGTSERPSAEVFLCLGLARRRQGRMDEAIDCYSKALLQRPDWHELANELAWLLVTQPHRVAMQPRWPVVLAERACADTGHQDADYLDTLAAAYAHAGRFDEAVQTIGRALDCLPTTDDQSRRQEMLDRQRLYRAGLPYRENAETQLALARLLLQDGQNDRAAALAEAALSSSHENPEFLALLAIARRRQERIDEAIDLYHRALHQRPHWPRVQNELAWLLATRRPTQARTAVQLASDACRATAQRDPLFLDTLAAAYAAAGDFAAARQTIGRALDLVDGDDALRGQLRQRQARYESGRPWQE